MLNIFSPLWSFLCKHILFYYIIYFKSFHPIKYFLVKNFIVIVWEWIMCMPGYICHSEHMKIRGQLYRGGSPLPAIFGFVGLYFTCWALLLKWFFTTQKHFKSNLKNIRLELYFMHLLSFFPIFSSFHVLSENIN